MRVYQHLLPYVNIHVMMQGLFEVASGLGYALGPVIGGLIYQVRESFFV